MLIPDAVRVPVYKDNLIAGLAMNMWGPLVLRLIFRGFVVVVGFLILSGAVNTAIIGSNGVLNRVSEDGVLADWFRFPHRKYGTTYRIINLVVLLQIVTIMASRGDVYVLGEAYAFGVIWSFTFNSLAMLVLRFKYKGERGWKVPPNITIAGNEIPIGLFSVFLVLLSTALVNLATKSVATVAGVSFSVVFFVIFTVSEHANRKKHALAKQQMKDHFQLLQSDTVERDSLGIRPGNVLVPGPRLQHAESPELGAGACDTREQDVVVMTARVSQFGTAAYGLSTEQIFSDYEQTLFTRAVSVAESFGKKISLLVVPARDPWSAIAQTAHNLESSAVVAGALQQNDRRRTGLRPGHSLGGHPGTQDSSLSSRSFSPTATSIPSASAHTHPHMKNEDVVLLHRLWLNITREPGLENVHHHDILTEALTRFARDYGAHERERHRQGIAPQRRWRPSARPPHRRSGSHRSARTVAFRARQRASR